SGGEMQEPKVEQLMGKLRRLQQVMICVFCRRLLQNKKSEEQLEQYRCEIQELKLKHRKQIRFENQLHQLIELHKNLHSVFTPERLPGEIESARNTKSQLLSAGKYLLMICSCLFASTHMIKLLHSFPFPLQFVRPRSVILTEQLKLVQLRNLDEELEEVKRQKQVEMVATETEEM
uniref:Uncharacterized protein n=1 Tax=Stegastes partitus TaxID=144197 RepID=A0A3B5AI20_9TELE